MKTEILIKGQPNSVSVLLHAIQGNEAQVKPLQFGYKILVFKGKKNATNALSSAFRQLRSEEPEYYKEGGISYARGSYLEYDAGIATIL